MAAKASGVAPNEIASGELIPDTASGVRAGPIVGVDGRFISVGISMTFFHV
jgi:hypothetical protein